MNIHGIALRYLSAVNLYSSLYTVQRKNNNLLIDILLYFLNLMICVKVFFLLGR